MRVDCRVRQPRVCGTCHFNVNYIIWWWGCVRQKCELHNNKMLHGICFIWMKKKHSVMVSIRILRRFLRLPTGARIWHLDVGVGELKMSFQLGLRICLNLISCNKSRFSFWPICESASWPLPNSLFFFSFNLKHNECITFERCARDHRHHH